MPLKKYLLCAKAVSTHGVRGTVRLECHADSPEAICSLKKLYVKDGDDYKSMNVTKASRQKGMALVSFEGVETLEDAVRLKGKEFYADRDDFNLPEGARFIADIEGLQVIDEESGEVIGVVSQIMTGRSQNIYVVKDVKGGEFMIPDVSEFIRKIEVEGEQAGVYVKLIDGMRG